MAEKIQEKVEDTVSRANAMLNQTQAQGSKAFAGTTFDVKPVTPITPQDLSGGAEPFQIPTQLPAVEAAGLGGAIQAQTEATQQQIDEAKVAEERLEDSRSNFLESFLTPGETELEAIEASKPGGLDDITVELNAISQEILQEQNLLKNQLDRLETAHGGMLEGAFQDEVARLENASLKKQANLSIIQMGIQGRFDSAKAIADRAVAIQFERDTTRQNLLKTVYEDNKDQFTLKEQRAFDSAQAQRDDAIEQEREEAQALSDAQQIAIQNLAVNGLATPQMIRNIMAQDSMEGVTQVAGQGGVVDLLERESQRLANVQAGLNIQKTQQEVNKVNEIFSGEFANVIQEIQSLDVSNDKIKNLSANLNAQLEAGDYVGAIASLENTIEGSFTGEVKTKFANQRTDFGVMSQLRDAIQEYSDGGGDMGLLVGTAEDISNSLLGVTTNPELTTLATQLNREFQTYRTNATGAAFSPEESREYAKVNPRTTASMDLNLAVIDGALNALDDRIVETVTRRVPSAKAFYEADATGVTSTNLPDEQIDSDYELYRQAALNN